MDQPTVSSEAPERAVSSEPSSTRPNPFTEGDDASRKRRRTSMSGGSRSRSAESIGSGLQASSSSAADHLADDPTAQDTAMKIDTGPSTPQTPELQSTAREPPTRTPSSRVTINLRNATQADISSSASPISPTPQTLPAQATDIPDAVKRSVEDMDEVDMVQAPIEITDTPPSTSSSMQSPEVEVVAIPDDDQDASFEDEISIVRDDGVLPDPTPDFPYREPIETLPATVNKLANYLSTSISAEDVIMKRLHAWMLSYIKYVHRVGIKAAYDSHIAYPEFWQNFPEIAWVLANRKPPMFKECQRNIVDFFFAYSKLASFLIDFDLLSAQSIQLSTDTERRHPEFLLSRHLPPLLHFVRREDTNAGQVPEEDIFWTRDVTQMMKLVQSRCDGIRGLNKLTQLHLKNAQKYQNLMEVLVPLVNLAAIILRKILRAVQLQMAPGNSGTAKARLADGHVLYDTIWGVFSGAIDRNVTQISTETAQSFINSLSEILRAALNGDDKRTTERLEAHRQASPNVPPKFTADAITLEWRLGVYGRLITSSQMQLRVMAASGMCLDLVACWKKHSDNDEDSSKYLTYAAEYLLRTRLVDYILGPTCHPEITVESGNIVGFLMVTRFYRNEQTDLLWQTITTTQDPRVSEALLRMTASITNLCHKEDLLYLCEKLQTMPIDNFTPPVRQLFDSILKHLHANLENDAEAPSILPLKLCIRLLRESSTSISESHISYPDVHQFASAKFKELVREGLDPEIRRQFYADCIRDIAAKSSTTLGTLWCLHMSLRPAVASELRVLTTEHNLTALLVDELEHAIEQGKRTGTPYVLCELINQPRRDLITCILNHEPSTITSDLGPRLWDMLVGHGAACREDRNAGWFILNSVPTVALGNPFLSVCFTEYLPKLPRDCLCEGTLQFVNSTILPRVNDLNSVDEIVLDDEESLAQSGVEQLWRMILDAQNPPLVTAAIGTLVGDIYVDSKSILTYTHHRACRVHLALANRCLRQMEDSAKRLEASGDDTRNGEDEPMVLVLTEEQIKEQERIFTRSLAVLQSFLTAHQAKAQFSAPDLRSLTPGSPSAAEGDSAELKVQSFDGDKQTGIVALEVGRRNTAASLLASIKKATGFDNYRIYYGGHALAPRKSDVCRTLESLKIHDGLILVKREDNGTVTAKRVKPGASLLEIEILGHFDQLWNYLSMSEPIAKEIYTLLIKLPADTQMLAAFDAPDTAYQDIFPSGQPFKSLYAMYAMEEYMDSAAHPLEDGSSTVGSKGVATDAYFEALARVRRLVVAAITDSDIFDSCASDFLRNHLMFVLMNSYVLKLEERDTGSAKPGNVFEFMAPAKRLVDILVSAVTAQRTETSISLIGSVFTAIVRSIAIEPAFWTSLQELPNFGELLGTLLLDEPADKIRSNIAASIEEMIGRPEEPNESTRAFCGYIWTVLHGLIPRAVELPKQCYQVFRLSRLLLEGLKHGENDPTLAVDVPKLARQCGQLLLEHDSTEHLGHPSFTDGVAGGLAALLKNCLRNRPDLDVEDVLPRNFSRSLFWKHLFPPSRHSHVDRGRSCILSHETRDNLTHIISDLVSRSEQDFVSLLVDLEKLVPFDDFGNDPYLYELQPQFDRMSAIRAPCGYSGLRNLSNTCYLNSLFSQLFMNTGFRQFMLGARIPDHTSSHCLLRETRKLFAYMQESWRKFIDPSLLVGSIKTYEETIIDVHNQMDVDEFYNLLFDRWEGQLSTAEERKALRSFYGGQLVQQVASKECEHISERLEPFSAIQCDIKGKSTLQDSLQAYVDGEIMEGDNKYKCSKCDRHVDAVKRACLKDIPDNLIFHLKRFDFNLRTLMRSKINDYFSFPTEIDMRPYTIDHLGSPSDSGEEDMFELVGVLVHAGTAESGHYYSYIRERPTTPSAQNWFEFNDDLVSPWNPADLEKSTFGGSDAVFENGAPYDKTYSAYMLFYQRSSVLKAEQDKSQNLCLSTPLKVDVPVVVAEHINGENTILLRRHCLYDPGHARFVLNMFLHARGQGPGCSYAHSVEQRSMYMLLGHLDQVVSRTKDLPDFELFQYEIEQACTNCVKCAFDFFGYFQDRHEAFRQLLQRNPDPNVRLAVSNMFNTALQTIKASDSDAWGFAQDVPLEEPIMVQAVQLFETLWNNFHTNIRSWAEVFQTVLAFARMGRAETALLLSEDWLTRVLRIVFVDTNMELENNYARMLTNVMRRANNTRATRYDEIIQLIDHFMDNLESTLSEFTLVDSAEVRLESYVENPTSKLSWAPSEANILLHEWGKGSGSTFIKKLNDLDQAHSHTASIVKRAMRLSSEMEIKVFCAVKNMITGQMAQHSVAPHINAAIVVSEASINGLYVSNLFQHIATQCHFIQNTEGAAFLDFFKAAHASIRDSQGPDVGRSILFIDYVPLWGPSLLGYYDVMVRRDTEQFLSEWLDDHESGRKPDDRMEVAVNLAVRKLCMNCFFYLRDNFLLKRGQVASQAVGSLQNIIQGCEEFFRMEIDSGAEQVYSLADYQDGCRSIIEPLRRMTFEEVEDEGSDWENSCASSEPVESLADISMQTVAEVRDAALH